MYVVLVCEVSLGMIYNQGPLVHLSREQSPYISLPSLQSQSPHYLPTRRISKF